MRSGIVGTSVTALVRDVRRILEPNTASHLRVIIRPQLLDLFFIKPSTYRNVDRIDSRILLWLQDS